MDAKKYVDAIVRKIKCSKKRKKEIHKQLLSDIQMRVKQGEGLEAILSQMGTITEIADSFNETISQKEQRRYVRTKALKMIIPAIAVPVFLIAFVYWMLPKSSDIERSRYFDKAVVEDAMKETIALLDAGDYAALQTNATPRMQTHLNAETFENVKKTLSDDWGEQKMFGAVYMVELIQKNTHSAVGETTITYENVSVTYRLTFDETMRIAGVYMR